MLDQFVNQGRTDVLVRFGLVKQALGAAPIAAAAPGLGTRAMGLVRGQGSAGMDLLRNLRGGLGGKMNPELVTGTVPAASMDIARASHRAAAIGNLKTLTPTLLAGGGLYMMHRHNQAKRDAEARQRAMMAQQNGVY